MCPLNPANFNIFNIGPVSKHIYFSRSALNREHVKGGLNIFWEASHQAIKGHRTSFDLRLYCRAPATWFGGDVSVQWCGFWSESQNYRPKVEVTDRKVTAGIRTESARKGTRIGLRSCYRKPPFRPFWLRLNFDLFCHDLEWLNTSQRAFPWNLDTVWHFSSRLKVQVGITGRRREPAEKGKAGSEVSWIIVV